MIKNNTKAYGSITKIFHWTMGIMIIGIVIAGFIMTDMDPSDQKWFIYKQHKAFGVIILSLIPLRILWRFLNTHPALPESVPTWQRKAANLNILFLYLVMVAMPLSGFLMSSFGGHPISMFDLFQIAPFEKNPEISKPAYDVHMFLAWAIAVSIALHIAGALFHHFVRKDGVLKRMLPFVK